MIDSIQQSISRSVIIGNIKNLNYDKMDFRKKTAGNPEQKKTVSTHYYLLPQCSRYFYQITEIKVIDLHLYLL